MSMLDVRSLYVTYLSEKECVEAVRGIDFSAEEGKVTGIVGESGSGKSTAMLAVTGLLDRKAAVEAKTISLSGNTVRAGENAAIIFQDPLKCLDPTVKIGRQIAETVRNRKKCTWREAKKRSEELLDLVGIRYPRLRMKQYPFELSGGMRQRVVIAIALACEPNLIVADEPTTALDAAMQVRVIRLLKKIVKETNTALLLVSHNMGVIAAACDYVYVMKDGKMIENGCADDIFYNPQTEYTKKLLSDATAEQLLVKEKVFAAQENPLFTVRHLKKQFQNEEGVNDVSFDICEGEVFALAGESGSGKTTLAKILTGLEQPDSGEVFCRGERVDRKNRKRNKNMHGKVRMIFQDPYSSLNPCMTINEMLMETLRAKERQIKFDQKEKRKDQKERRKDQKRQIEQMLIRVGLSSLDGKRYPRELSGGQRQRAAIGRALLSEPELLICDEAVSSLDAATRTQILDLLLQVIKEKKIACLFISHDMALIRRISNRTGVLYKGTLVECAKTRDLCKDPWHPYTKVLLDSVMPPDPLKARKQKVPAVHEEKSEGGCPYFGSCGYKMEMCKSIAPEMYEFEGRAVFCHLYSKEQSVRRDPNYKMTSQI